VFNIQFFYTLLAVLKPFRNFAAHLVIVSCAGNDPKGNPVRLSLTNYSGAVPAAVNPIQTYLKYHCHCETVNSEQSTVNSKQ
jgi:hypothetical protein